MNKAQTSLLLTCVVTLAGGCAPSTESIDARLSRLVQDQSARLGDGLPISPVPGGDVPERPASSLVRSPETRDPAAQSLRYRMADPTRDVSSRLSALSEQSGMLEAGAEIPAGTLELTLPVALRQVQASGREILSAQEEYILSAIGLLRERHLWGPRFFNDTRAQIEGSGDGGDFSHALSIVNTLRASQRLPAGGEIEAAWIWDATEQLRETAGGRYTQSSRLVLSGRLPLLRGAGDVAREDLIQAERDLVYAARDFERFRRENLVQTSQEYFALVRTLSQIKNQDIQLANLRENATRTRALVASGRLEAFETGIADSEVLSAENSRANLRERYLLQLERFKIRLGLPPDQPVAIRDAEILLPEPDIGIEEATNLALEYRLDFQNERDQVDDQRRAVANARNELLPDLDLSGEVGLPTDPADRVGGLTPSTDDLDYEAGVTLSLPLDKERERLAWRAAIIGLRRAERDLEQARDQIIVSVRSALRAVELARFQLQLAEEQVKINERRREGQLLQRDLITTQVLLDTEAAVLDARDNRDAAVAELRTAVLNYLLESGQMRVSRDGTFLAPSGMDASGVN
jgi:outer membrane protein TolC